MSLSENVTPNSAQQVAASLWGVAEISLHATSPQNDPFDGVIVTAEATSPTGRLLHLRGFFDGGDTWRVRLMPDEEGEWTIVTHSNVHELAQITATVTVGPADLGRHGPVRVVDDRHFRYADGEPYFMLGTTQYGGLSGGPEALARSLARLTGSPFTKARFMLLGGLFEPDAPSPFERLPDGGTDYDRPNPDFFQHLESGLARLQEIGMEADLILFVPYFDLAPDHKPGDRTPSTMGAAADIRFARYVSARLSAFANVWWTLANEFDLHVVQKDWDAIAAAVADGDPYGHLTSNHHSILGFFDNSSAWVTHVNLQDVLLQRSAAGPRDLSELARGARDLGKPVVVDEYGYEGNNGYTWGSFSGAEMADMHWAIAFAGAYGSHGESFAGEDSDSFVGDAVPRLAFLREILETTFPSLTPAPQIFEHSGAAFVPLALADPGRQYLVYVPVPRELPDWNLGNFGPATPAAPLPLSGDGLFSMIDTSIRITMEPGRYAVDLIDPWRMRVTTLGITEEHSVSIVPRLTPGIVRFRRTDAPGRAQTIAELLAPAAPLL